MFVKCEIISMLVLVNAQYSFIKAAERKELLDIYQIVEEHNTNEFHV